MNTSTAYEEEFLDIVDENGSPTGQVAARNIIHQQGLRHRTSHVWLVRFVNDTTEILLQKRSLEKDSFPGCYDISSAGHIPAGMDFIPSALRELKEELGVTATADDLIYCGTCHDRREHIFHQKNFSDNQISNVYLLFCNRESKDFLIQKEELSEVVWMNLEDCMCQVASDAFPHCIRLNELEMVRVTLKNILEKNPLQYPPLSVCSECKGQCCKSLGCSLSPEDLLKTMGSKTYSLNLILEILQNNHFAIDSFSHLGKPFYFLRMQHKCFTFIGVDAMGECIALSDRGCLLTYNDRPKGGKYLEAREDRQCLQHYTREEMISDWLPYQPVLSSIWDEYYHRFTEDGTFDACEEAYMKYQMSKRKS